MAAELGVGHKPWTSAPSMLGLAAGSGVAWSGGVGQLFMLPGAAGACRRYREAGQSDGKCFGAIGSGGNLL
eukprot:8338714-Alexandrium_andersonii.AAC.1